MPISLSEVQFLSFAAKDKPYAEAILELILNSYEGSAVQGLAVLASNRNVQPYLVHAFHSFTLTLRPGWVICVYRNGGKDYWTVQQVCGVCLPTRTASSISYRSRWEPAVSGGKTVEVLSCRFCGVGLASPDTGVYFTFNSKDTAGFSKEQVEEQLVEQDIDYSVLEAMTEAEELRCLILRLIAVSSNTVFWSHSDRLSQLLDEAPG